MPQNSIMAERSRLQRTIDDNPAYTELYLAVLKFCAVEQSQGDVLSYIDTAKTSNAQIQSASSIVESLIKRGGLAETISVDDTPYEGTLDELQIDEAIPEDASIAITLQTTAEGQKAIAATEDSLSFSQLVATCPEREPAFRTVLDLCAASNGASTSAVQDVLRQQNMLEADDNTGIEALHASYFTGALEHIGALVWDRNRWVTSEKGLAILNA